MFVVIVAVALVAVGLVAYTLSRTGKSGEEQPLVYGKDCLTCSGENDKCEQECTMEAALRPVEYFDDEELDAFKGRASDGYEDDEVEQFAYVLHTMQTEDVAPWMRSLTLRGINLPDELKDEVMLLLEN